MLKCSRDNSKYYHLIEMCLKSALMQNLIYWICNHQNIPPKNKVFPPEFRSEHDISIDFPHLSYQMVYIYDDSGQFLCVFYRRNVCQSNLLANVVHLAWCIGPGCIDAIWDGYYTIDENNYRERVTFSCCFFLWFQGSCGFSPPRARGS